MGTLFSLEILPAGEGDCLLVHWGDAPSIAVIDGGPGRVFEEALRVRLEEIRQKRGFDTLNIELVMVSHVDNDHIVGVKKLFRELCADETRGTPDNQRKFQAQRLWHNAFTDILGDKFDSYYTPSVTAALAATTSHAASPTALADAGLDNITEDEEQAHHLALVLAGHAEGRTLRDSYRLLYDARRISRLNTPFLRNGQPSPVMRATQVEETKIAGLKLRVVGPSEAELSRLRSDFDKYLVTKGLSIPASLAAAAADQDSSPTNLSSIVCLLEFWDKKVLLTGDARGDRILKDLEDSGLLEDGRLHVHVLKVPHHGSARNASPEFFKKISADTYVISADGKHGNPDRKLIQWLVKSRDPHAHYKLVFTYPLADIDATRKLIHERKQEWNSAEHAVETLIASYKRKGHAFTCSIGHTVIELGEQKLAC